MIFESISSGGCRSYLHTHADHFSATRQLADQLDAPVVMHRASPAPAIVVHPGHTNDSMCLCLEDRVFTGDTLLIGRPAEPIYRAATPRRCTRVCSRVCSNSIQR